MTLRVTQRDKLILGAFILLLFASCYAYYRWATAPASPRQPVQPTARPLQRQRETSQPTTDVAQAPLVVEEESLTTLPKRDYRFIAERNIFQLPNEKPKRQKSDESSKPTLARPPSSTMASPASSRPDNVSSSSSLPPQ